MRSLAIAVMLAGLLAPATATAGTTGALIGSVKDANSGAPLSGARVVVESPAQREQTTTDAKGDFTFVSLSPNTYTVFVSLSHYGATAHPNVTVDADATQKIAIALQHVRVVAHLVDCPAPSIIACPYMTSFEVEDVYFVSPRTPFYSFNGSDIYALHFVPGLTFGAGPLLAR